MARVEVAGARAAGIAPVWVNRRGLPVPGGRTAADVIGPLTDLAPRLARG